MVLLYKIHIRWVFVLKEHMVFVIHRPNRIVILKISLIFHCIFSCYRPKINLCNQVLVTLQTLPSK